MSDSLFLIFNHEITPAQESDAYGSLCVQRIINMPPDLKDLWRQIPPDLPKISAYLTPIKSWLSSEAQKNDHALIQGDFGACYIMVTFAFQNNLVPVYSTTAREAVEVPEKDGSVKLIHKFNHVIYRRYNE